MLNLWQICQGKRADKDVLPWLLQLTASSLQNLVVRRREGLKTTKKTYSRLVPGHAPPCTSTASNTPTMPQLRSLTLHVDQEPEERVSTFFLETFEQATKCVQAVHGGSKLGALLCKIECE